jgi:hypothetical protein
MEDDLNYLLNGRSFYFFFFKWKTTLIIFQMENDKIKS